ncbi:MAG: nucleotidyltransferase domain-containing protein [Candidatus Hodarchaeales archaeon]
MQGQSSNFVKIKYPPSVETLQKLLKEFVSKLKYSNVQKIILIGSYARKTPRYRSDVDLVVITTTEDKNLFDIIYTDLIELSSDFEWAPIVISNEHLARMSPKWLDMLENEGVEIYPNFNY